MVNAFLQELKLRNPRPSPGAPTFPGLSPSDCLCIYLVCTGGVYGRSGSFKHCSKYIALIKGITSQKRQKKKKKKQHKLLSGVVWSFKKRDIQSQWLSHCIQQYHTETKKPKEHSSWDNGKGKSTTFSQVHQSHSQCTSLMINYTVFGPANNSATKPHQDVTVVGSDPYINQTRVHVYSKCTGLLLLCTIDRLLFIDRISGTPDSFSILYKEFVWSLWIWL